MSRRLYTLGFGQYHGQAEELQLVLSSLCRLGCTLQYGLGSAAVPGQVLIGVAQTASSACFVRARIGTRSQQSICDRVL